MDRRDFLRSGTATLALASLGADDRKTPNDRTPVIDTHLHCFAGPNDPRFPYHPNGPYRPEKPATPERLLECMDGAGIDYAVVVHPEPYQDDHRYLKHCLDVGGERLKGTCLFFPDRPGCRDGMRSLAGELGPRLVAARIHAYAPDRLPPFGRSELREFWKQAAELGLAVQLHFEPRYAPGFEPLIREFSQVTVIIDHLGRPFQGTPEEHAAVVSWSRFPNTVMKLSSLPAASQYPHREIRPIVLALRSAYGSDRLMYGGGFDAEATPASYRSVRERVRSYLDGFDDDQQARVLGGNAARLFGFPGTV